MMRKKPVKTKQRNAPILSMIKKLKLNTLSGVIANAEYISIVERVSKSIKSVRLMKENDLIVNKIRYKAKRKTIFPKPKASYPNHFWVRI